MDHPSPVLDHSKNGGEALKTFDIFLEHTNHAGMLANITNRYPFTIALRQGRYVVDGKSLLGICSLEHSKPIVLEAYTDQVEGLANDIRPLIR